MSEASEHFVHSNLSLELFRSGDDQIDVGPAPNAMEDSKPKQNSAMIMFDCRMGALLGGW
jgi:hypothetical protein